MTVIESFAEELMAEACPNCDEVAAGFDLLAIVDAIMEMIERCNSPESFMAHAKENSRMSRVFFRRNLRRFGVDFQSSRNLAEVAAKKAAGMELATVQAAFDECSDPHWS